MRTETITIFKFSELSDEAKQKAISEHRETGICGDFCWDNIKEDAEQIGLKIFSLDNHRPNSGEFQQDGQYCVKLIIENHGKDCETYKTAKKYLEQYEAIFKKAETSGKDGDEDYWFEDEISEIDAEFLAEILEDYRILYNMDIEYHESDEAIIETIEANEYEFNEDGTIY